MIILSASRFGSKNSSLTSSSGSRHIRMPSVPTPILSSTQPSPSCGRSTLTSWRSLPPSMARLRPRFATGAVRSVRPASRQPALHTPEACCIACTPYCPRFEVRLFSCLSFSRARTRCDTSIFCTRPLQVFGATNTILHQGSAGMRLTCSCLLSWLFNSHGPVQRAIYSLHISTCEVGP
ncbi:hypothetical protein B0H19DRAFT_1203396 [Mycena capillaripes]|nr:hypothetical protein B0H19DRAFT_1203396 [Mycena capillaripes]